MSVRNVYIIVKYLYIIVKTFVYHCQTYSKLLDVTNSQPVTETEGMTQQEFLLDMLDQKAKKQGIKGSIFKKEEKFYNDAMTIKFRSLMVRMCYIQVTNCNW